jgi:pyruvate dehydrogenase E2 component (dihydrolipoamide acetyltransferase)
MSKALVIPKLGMTMKEAKIVGWKAQEGEWVEQGRIVLVIETAKVTYEVEAPMAGFLHIVAAPGETLAVGQPTAWLAESKEELSELQAREPVRGVKVAAGSPVEERIPMTAGETGVTEGRRVRISPAAKKLAEMHDLDYTSVVGTGPDGRIVKEDVQRAIAAGGVATETAFAQPQVKEWTGEILDGKRIKKSFRLEGMRAAIAEHMIRSLKTSAQVTTTHEIDMTEMIRIRESYLTREEKIGIRVSVTDLVTFVLARTLKDVPMMNASLIDGRLILWEDINIGVAVAIRLNELETGLIVPVVRNADKKTLMDLSTEIRDLTQRARSLKLQPDDLGGGTFTLTNVGAFGNGWSISTPIINQPEAAILGTGVIEQRAVVRNGEIVARPMMSCFLTFDHRILDGAPVAEFLARFKEFIENPGLMLL